MDLSRAAISRRNWLYLVGVEVVLFVLSNVTAKNNSHPGAASNVLWVAFLIGILALIVLGAASLVRLLASRRSRAG
jgi:low temperature requirement protein LtrA